ncbi:MAG: hypothetical protein KGI66_03245 [Patescibacteria group bacterium]|nr:hypothetical protein [Patescibacteria group bacterium]
MNAPEYNKRLFPARTPNKTRVIGREVLPAGASGGYDPKHNQAAIPLGDDASERYTRMHEAAHATWSLPGNKTDYVGQSIEDMFITHKLPATGQAALDSFESVYRELATMKDNKPRDPRAQAIYSIVAARNYAILDRIASEFKAETSELTFEQIENANALLASVIKNLPSGARGTIAQAWKYVQEENAPLARAAMGRLIKEVTDDSKRKETRKPSKVESKFEGEKGKPEDSHASESDSEEAETSEDRDTGEDSSTGAPSSEGDKKEEQEQETGETGGESEDIGEGDAQEESEEPSKSTGDKLPDSPPDSHAYEDTLADFDKSLKAEDRKMIERDITESEEEAQKKSAKRSGTASEWDTTLTEDLMRVNIEPIEHPMPQATYVKRILGSIASSPKYSGTRLNQRKLYDAAVSPVPVGEIRAFTRKSKGVTILIDASGSMSLSNHEIASLLRAAPGCTIAVYNASTRWSEDGMLDGYITIIAKHGMVITDVTPLAKKMELRGFNLIDYQALQWLLREPGPRYMVTDIAFTGVLARKAEIALNNAVKARQVTQCWSIERLLEKLERA